MVIDTRSSHVQGREVLDDLRELTTAPVTVVVDTHGHFDHAFGNHVFRPAPIWGHVGCGPFLERTGEARKARIATEVPELATDLADVVIDPPDRTFAETADLDLGDRRVELRFLGRGHTDHDIVIRVPDAGVLFAGDLLENGAVPSFGDAYPLDWPETAFRVAELAQGVVVPGHGDHGGAGLRRRAGGRVRRARRAGPPCPSRRPDHRRCRRRDAVPGVSGRGGAAAPRARAAAAPRRARLTRSPALLPDPDDPAAAGVPGDDAVERLLERVEGDLGAVPPRSRGRRSVARRSHSSRRRAIGMLTESIPSNATPRRMNGKTVVCEPRAPGVAGRGDRGADLERPQHVRQRRPADRVDRPGPALRFERPCPRRSPRRGSGSRPRPASGSRSASSRLAGRRPDLVAAVRQDREGRAADPAARAGHEDRPVIRAAGRAPRGRRRTSPP